MTAADVTVVLVHGAWADGSSWGKVVAILQEQGIPVIAVQNSTASLDADVEATRRALNTVPGPVVLAGHSWGGTVITQAGTDAKVKALVYVAAFAPDIGQSTGDQVALHDQPPALGEIAPDANGDYRMSEHGWITCVGQDLPEKDARVLAAIQPPLSARTFSDKVTVAAWAQRKTWYVVSVQDRAVSVALQRDLAAKMKAATTMVEASHMSLLSQPQTVASVLLQAVDALRSGAL